MLKTILVAVAALAAGPALAQTSNWTVDATIGGVSDYRYRGYSLTDGDPALQGGATLTHRSGLYTDIFVSAIDEYGVGDDGDGADIEITATFGWSGSVSGYDVDAGVSAYRYPDGDEVNYVEFPLQVGRTLNALTGTLGFAYAPEQTALGDEDNRYGWASLAYATEDWPVSLGARLGYEDGSFAPDGKTDWELGLTRDFGPATLGLAWTDSDRTDGTVVASLSVGF